MKVFKFTFLIFVMVFGSCITDKENEPFPGFLVGSKWKLSAIVNSQTGEATKINTLNLVAYKLMFDTNSTFTASGIGMRHTFDLRHLENPIKEEIWGEYEYPYILQIGNEIFCVYSFMHKISSYSATYDEFKLFVLNGDYYLSYVPYEEVDTLPTYLEGTKWKLAGFFDTQTDTLIKELQPYDCGNCYTLSFETDYIATAYDLESELTLDLLDPLQHIPRDMITQPIIVGDDLSYRDNKEFRRGIALTVSYFATPDELKLFILSNLQFVESNYYLLFKPL